MNDADRRMKASGIVLAILMNLNHRKGYGELFDSLGNNHVMELMEDLTNIVEMHLL